jgi:hypothetical protein
VFLSLALAQFYEHEPRVTIDTSPAHFHWYRFGRCIVMTHHGHMVKPDALPAVMACDRPQDWGETLYRYIITGHIHHKRVQEFPGVLWESLRSPTSSDAWHHASGYRSGHDVMVDTLHRDHGSSMCRGCWRGPHDPRPWQARQAGPRHHGPAPLAL